jgi:Icc-related predicted phosphoesterase
MSKVRIAAASDLHCRVDCQGKFRRSLGPAADEADVLVLTGDLTDYGLLEEAEVLAEELGAIRIPKVAVLGNHDYEGGKAPELTKLLGHAGVHILAGEVWVFDKRLGIAGVKGFCGGFDANTLQAWGEGPIKAFVLESINEALKLEMALAKLDAIGLTSKVALTHYAPVRSTVVGEKVEIFPFLGCSRLAEAIDKQSGVVAAFHGHAHHGALRGATPKGVPVYNVAMPLLKAELDRRYLVVEVDCPSIPERAWHESPSSPSAGPASNPHPS